MLKKAAGKLVGKRTLIAAVAKIVFSMMVSAGVLPEAINSVTAIAMIENILDGLVYFFLALKGNRMLSGGIAWSKSA